MWGGGELRGGCVAAAAAHLVEVAAYRPLDAAAALGTAQQARWYTLFINHFQRVPSPDDGCVGTTRATGAARACCPRNPVWCPDGRAHLEDPPWCDGGRHRDREAVALRVEQVDTLTRQSAVEPRQL
mgnify:CR=1 FL=1